jgi:hypothetical protein
MLRRTVPTDAKGSQPPEGLIGLVRSGTVDAELGALLWLLREGGLPGLVIGPVGEASVSVVADALDDLGESRAAEDPPGATSVRTLRAGSLQEALDILSSDPFHLTDDAIRGLGMVLVVRAGRVAAAHYLRPVERDREGHLQRRPPAVLATWEQDAGRFEHFAWAVTPELAVRVNRTQAALEEEAAARARILSVAA